MPRPLPKRKASHNVIYRLATGISAVISAVVVFFQFLYGARPVGPLGPVVDILRTPFPAWTHILTFTAAMGCAMLLEWLLGIFSDSEEGLPGHAKDVIEIQDKAINALEVHARLKKEEAKYKEEELNKYIERYAQLSIDLGNSHDERERLNLKAEFAKDTILRVCTHAETVSNNAIVQAFTEIENIWRIALALGLPRETIHGLINAASGKEGRPPANPLEMMVFHDACQTIASAKFAAAVIGIMLVPRILVDFIDQYPEIRVDELLNRVMKHPDMARVIEAEKKARGVGSWPIADHPIRDPAA